MCTEHTDVWKYFMHRRWTRFTRSLQCTSIEYNLTMHVVVYNSAHSLQYYRFRPHTRTYRVPSIGECDQTIYIYMYNCIVYMLPHQNRIQCNANSIVVASVHHLFFTLHKTGILYNWHAHSAYRLQRVYLE